jgi:hypothetical protein
MVTDDREDGRAVMLKGWQKAVDDREALLRDPEAHASALIEQAKQARAQGIIGDEDLRELLEWVDAAYSWAVEEQLTRELNQ